VLNPSNAEAVSTIQLRDGRVLAYLEVGKSDGPVVIHCHGSGSSRLEALIMADAANEVGIRLVALDRPGIGRSDPHPYVNIADWTNDLAEFVDRLGLREFAVQGLSNGGPYALASAWKLPGRVRACGLISSVPPGEIVRERGPLWMRFMWAVGRNYPRAFHRYLQWVVPDTKISLAESDKQVRTMIRWMSGPDRRAMQNEALRSYLEHTLMEHRRQGGAGARHEAEIGMRPWGFAVSEIRCERLFLWHGEQDRVIKVDLARAFAAALPHCSATYFADEGHFSLIANRARDVLIGLR